MQSKVHVRLQGKPDYAVPVERASDRKIEHSHQQEGQPGFNVSLQNH
jgi:hypothetical protein